MSTWALFFAWPNGGVWSNLIASAVTTTLAGTLVAWRFLKKLAAEHERHRQLMQKQLDVHHKRVLQTMTGGDHGSEPDAGS